jgi:hypothetical protein
MHHDIVNCFWAAVGLTEFLRHLNWIFNQNGIGLARVRFNADDTSTQSE